MEAVTILNAKHKSCILMIIKDIQNKTVCGPLLISEVKRLLIMSSIWYASCSIDWRAYKDTIIGCTGFISEVERLWTMSCLISQKLAKENAH